MTIVWHALFFACLSGVLWLRALPFEFMAAVAFCLLIAGNFPRLRYASLLVLSILVLPFIQSAWDSSWHDTFEFSGTWAQAYFAFCVILIPISIAWFWIARASHEKWGTKGLVLCLSAICLSSLAVASFIDTAQAYGLVAWLCVTTPFTMHSAKNAEKIRIRPWQAGLTSVWIWPKREQNIQERPSAVRRAACGMLAGFLMMAIARLVANRLSQFGFSHLDTWLERSDELPLTTGRAWLIYAFGFVWVQTSLVYCGLSGVAAMLYAGFELPWLTGNIFAARDFYSFFFRYNRYFAEMVYQFFFYPTLATLSFVKKEKKLFWATFITVGCGNWTVHALFTAPFLLKYGVRDAVLTMLSYFLYSGTIGFAVALAAQARETKRAASGNLILRQMMIWSVFFTAFFWDLRVHASLPEKIHFLKIMLGLQ